MLRLYPDEDEREALEEEPGYLEEDAGLDEMDMHMATSADQYTFEEVEDQLYMQQAPSDTLIALQLLRSQFPAKARVGSHTAIYAAQSAL